MNPPRLKPRFCNPVRRAVVWKRFRTRAGIVVRACRPMYEAIMCIRYYGSGRRFEPERVMNDYKAYASRRLNRMGLDGQNRKRTMALEAATYLGSHAICRGRAE